ncbi:MAG: amidohydrolase family protein [Xanthomonadales bacterium]|nr:amidohydrolase family protein [Xanthomonadales bacterium]
MTMRLLVLLFSLTAGSAGADTGKFALVDGTVITATGDAPIAGATVLVDEGRIKGVLVGKTTPAGYEVVDVSGKFITPGIIDTNIHLILTTVPEFFVKYEDRLVDIAIQSAQIGLKQGLTTMPDTWGPLKPLLEARDRINSGEFVGSRVLVAGNIIGTGGPFSPYFMGGWPARGLTLRYGGWVHPAIQRRIDALWEDDVGPRMIAMTPDEVAVTMRNYLAKGVDFVKVGVSGHGLGPAEPLLFSPEALEAIRSEVRRAGVPLLTHTFTIESLRYAVKMEPDLLMHPNVGIPPLTHATESQKQAIHALIAEIADKGIYAGLMSIPEKSQSEIYTNWDYSEHRDKPHLNEIMVNRQLHMGAVPFELRADSVRAWLDGGVKYTLATDQGPEAADLGPTVWGRLGRMHFDRMKGLQDVGASPMEVLIASTRHGAEAYGLDDELGTIEKGKIADLLVVDADPMEDINNIRQIHLVIKDGKIIDRDALPTVEVLDYDPELPWPF